MSKCTVISTRKANTARNHIHWFTRVAFSIRVFDKSVYMYMNMLLPFAMWCGKDDDIFKVLFMQARTHKNPFKRSKSTELFYWCIMFVVRFRIICHLIQLNRFFFCISFVYFCYLMNRKGIEFNIQVAILCECMGAWFVFDTHSTLQTTLEWGGLEKNQHLFILCRKR